MHHAQARFTTCNISQSLLKGRCPAFPEKEADGATVINLCESRQMLTWRAEPEPDRRKWN